MSGSEAEIEIPPEAGNLDLAGAIGRLRELQGEREEPKSPTLGENVIQVLGDWGVPARATETLWALKDTPLLNRAQQWASEPSWCLVLSGAKGCGKSVAAAWWIAQSAKDVTPTRKLSRKWWSGIRLARVDGYDGTLDRLAACRSLVIDDLGVEYADAKGAFQARLDFLLDERYGNRRRTVITTNLNAKEFAQRYGERIADRLREEAVWFESKAQSLRGTK